MHDQYRRLDTKALVVPAKLTRTCRTDLPAHTTAISVPSCQSYDLTRLGDLCTRRGTLRGLRVKYCLEVVSNRQKQGDLMLLFQPYKPTNRWDLAAVLGRSGSWLRNSSTGNSSCMFGILYSS
jgi:hypothetical protein